MKGFYITSGLLLTFGGIGWFVYQHHFSPTKQKEKNDTISTSTKGEPNFQTEIPVLQKKTVTADDVLAKKEKIIIDSQKAMMEFFEYLKEFYPKASEENLLQMLQEDKAVMRKQYQKFLKRIFEEKIAIAEVNKVKNPQITQFIENRLKKEEEEIYLEVFRYLIIPSVKKSLQDKKKEIEKKLQNDKVLDLQEVTVFHYDEEKARNYADEIMKSCQNIAAQGGNVEEFLKSNYDTGYPLYYYDENKEVLSESSFKDQKNLRSGSLVVIREKDIEGDQKEQIKRHKRKGQPRYAYKVLYVQKIRLLTEKEIEKFSEEIVNKESEKLFKEAIKEKEKKYEMEVK